MRTENTRTMIKWFQAQNASVKGMLILCVLLAAGIVIRWDYVSREAGGAFRRRFATETPADSLRNQQTDSIFVSGRP